MASTSDRGYGTGHQRLRGLWAGRIKAGEDVRCWRCHRPITEDTPWHLGHDDEDRGKYRGPECAHCNLSAAGRKGGPLAQARRRARQRKPEPHPGAR